MRISDWSSDVCSSDLTGADRPAQPRDGRDSRTAEELLLTAQLAAQIGSSRVAGLIALAAEKAPADPEVLIGCYMLSTQQGLENADHVHQWFAMAANLSGDDGPVQSADIEQLIDQAPDWDKRVSEAWDKLKAGDIPRYVAAKLLRRPSLELLLPPMLANRDEPRSEEHTSELQSLMRISYA